MRTGYLMGQPKTPFGRTDRLRLKRAHEVEKASVTLPDYGKNSLPGCAAVIGFPQPAPHDPSRA